MSEVSKLPHETRFLAQIEADMVLVDRDLGLIEVELEKLSEKFYKSLGKSEADSINAEFQAMRTKKYQLLQEKVKLIKEMERFYPQPANPDQQTKGSPS